mgnify:CR=1 FL=1
METASRSRVPKLATVRRTSSHLNSNTTATYLDAVAKEFVQAAAQELDQHRNLGRGAKREPIIDRYCRVSVLDFDTAAKQQQGIPVRHTPRNTTARYMSGRERKTIQEAVQSTTSHIRSRTLAQHWHPSRKLSWF